MNKKSVLVLLATGKLGLGIAEEFVKSGEFTVYGTSRNANHPTLTCRGIIPVPFEYGSFLSMQKALESCQA